MSNYGRYYDSYNKSMHPVKMVGIGIAVVTIVVAIIWAALAINWSGYHPNHGFVTGRSLIPAHEETSTYCIYPGQYGCMAYATDTYTVDDQYSLKLRNCVTNDSGKQKCQSGWHDVDGATYDQYDYEDFYPRAKLAQYSASPSF